MLHGREIHRFGVDEFRALYSLSRARDFICLGVTELREHHRLRHFREGPSPNALARLFFAPSCVRAGFAYWHRPA